jgi:hypothetical protein
MEKVGESCGEIMLPLTKCHAELVSAPHGQVNVGQITKR